MIRLMIGRDLKSLYIAAGRVHPAGRPARYRGRAHIDLSRTAREPEVRRGEILGLAGLVGSGRTELARAVFGIDRLRGGVIRLEGQPIVIRAPRDAIDRGIFLVPEDRKRAGLLLRRIGRGEHLAA